VTDPAGRVDQTDPTAAPSAGTVVQADGRAKAYRPLPEAERAAALRAGLEAYGRGDFFLAHELLEPAWMGTADPAERALLQGLIKLAAADVHGVRGNRRGVVRNLEGALERLRYAAAPDGNLSAAVAGLDIPALVAAVTDRLDRARRGAVTDPTVLPWSP
jgi:hypothetical protein